MMCGIIGILGKAPVAPLLLDGLKRLEYRGYDSAGIATLVDGHIDRRRAEGKLANLAALLDRTPLAGTVGIGHTRWATHGRPNEINAHPHATERVAVVHNGIIENFQELRDELTALGHVFETETDTETVAHLLTRHLDEQKSPEEAMAATMARLRGAFSVKLGWFPSGGLMAVGGAPTMLDRIADIAWHLVLPVATLALTYLALYLRLMRAAMLEAGRSDYIRTALAKGLRRRRIVWRHMARNAVLPVATMIGLQASALLGGSVVIETVFAVPGMGRLAYEAVAGRDLPLLMGVMLSSAVVVILVNLLLDLVYARLDPRIEA